ncbi:hypothetical protein TIFTF001_011534 [Ficus carica]|uniref:Uncharacterized protein n=1 Tax=Ficus carica TaxID=3494 RepID=A0AA88A0L2_FICCA|nr:hypothetical protein TIFTF001_011534 [Ficus carica]
MQLLGLLGRLKAITSELVASQCVKKLYESGDIQMINASDSQQLSQFAAHFIGLLTSQPQACNFAAFVPSGETTPLQRAEWIKFLGSFANLEDRANRVYNAFVEDAGGENVDDSINNMSYNISNPDDFEQLHAILCTVDVIIDETFTSDPVGYNMSTFLQNTNVEDHSCFAFLTNQSLWRYDKRIPNSNTLGKLLLIF